MDEHERHELDQDRERPEGWPDPRPEPEEEPVDPHRPPLDDDEDGRYLPPLDPRRLEAEKRRGRPFDEATIAQHVRDDDDAAP